MLICVETSFGVLQAIIASPDAGQRIDIGQSVVSKVIFYYTPRHRNQSLVIDA